jgi:hypothetical protein
MDQIPDRFPTSLSLQSSNSAEQTDKGMRNSLLTRRVPVTKWKSVFPGSEECFLDICLENQERHSHDSLVLYSDLREYFPRMR